MYSSAERRKKRQSVTVDSDGKEAVASALFNGVMFLLQVERDIPQLVDRMAEVSWSKVTISCLFSAFVMARPRPNQHWSAEQGCKLIVDLAKSRVLLVSWF